jgi:hypothetical protein
MVCLLMKLPAASGRGIKNYSKELAIIGALSFGIILCYDVPMLSNHFFLACQVPLLRSVRLKDPVYWLPSDDS